MSVKWLGWLLPLVLLACTGQSQPVLQLAEVGGDSGFGGTGVIRYSGDDDEGSSGFGGTGIVGNIEAFGSIWVNGIEIDYPEEVRIVSNLPGSELALKLGQTVVLETAEAANSAGRPHTAEIRILYTMAGPVQAVDDGRIRMHGEWVEIPAQTLMDDGLMIGPGRYIAINAHRNESSGWIASRLSANPSRGIVKPESVQVKFSERVSRLLVGERFGFIRPHWARHRFAPMKIHRQVIPGQQWRRMHPGLLRPSQGGPAEQDMRQMRHDMHQQEERRRQSPPPLIRRQMQAAPMRNPGR